MSIRISDNAGTIICFGCGHVYEANSFQRRVPQASPRPGGDAFWIECDVCGADIEVSYAQVEIEQDPNFVLDSAVVRYGESEYQLTMPREFDYERVCEEIRMAVPNPPELLLTHSHVRVLGFEVPEALVVHSPDWSIEVRYIKK